jgi:CheY-like chemotaxis protein
MSLDAGGGPTRVLVVEREPTRRAAMTRWLESLEGVTVVAVASAHEALASERPHSFGLYLLRHELSGVDGLTLGAMIRVFNTEARLVLLHAGSCPRTRRLALEHGFAAVVEDPLLREQLEALMTG